MGDLLFKWAREAPAWLSPREVMYRSLFGDAHITKGAAAVYKEGHAISQLPLIWSKAACLQDKLSRVHVSRGDQSSSSRDAIVGATSIVCPEAREMRDLFYPNGYKDLLREEVLEGFGWGTLAWWLMDDGSRYNSHGVKISIGDQEHYSAEGVELLAKRLSAVLQVPVKFQCSEKAFNLSLSREREVWFPKLVPHIHPSLAYKLGVPEKVCGDAWPKEYLSVWRGKLAQLEHPYLAGGAKDTLMASPGGRTLLRTALMSTLRYSGFPYPRYDSEKFERRYKMLASRDLTPSPSGSLVAGHAATEILSSFFPNRYHASVFQISSPYETYCRDGLLAASLDSHIESDRTKHISITRERLLNAIYFYRSRLAPHFNPQWAKYLIGLYGPAGARVLDPCGGWGGRMLGSALAGASEYCCVEPEVGTCEGLRQLAVVLKSYSPTVFSVHRGVAQDGDLLANLGAFDLAITCPPYFNHERYSDDPSQSSEQFSSYRSWVPGFLAKMIVNVFQALKPGAFFILVVGNIVDKPIAEDASDLAEDAGFSVERRIRLYVKKESDNQYCDQALILRRPL